MTNPESPVHIALAGGIHSSEQPLVDELLSRTRARLQAQTPGARAELSVKERDGAQMLTTLEMWLPGLPRAVATSEEPDLRRALSDIDRKALAQLSETTGRRQPKANRQKRATIREGEQQ